MKSIILSTVATVALALPAAAATVDFNSFAGAAAVNSLDFGGGLTATVATNSNRPVTAGGTNQAFAFDSNAFTGNDNDLVSPFPRTSNPSDEVDLGMVLVIGGPAASGSTSGSAGPTPDDDSEGGIITFTFSQLINFGSVDYVDTEANGNELAISFFDNGGALLGSSGDLVAGNGQFDTYSGLFSNVRSIAFDFGGSGAIDNLSVAAVPVPASLPILASGLALFGLMRRRRKAAS